MKQVNLVDPVVSSDSPSASSTEIDVPSSSADAIYFDEQGNLVDGSQSALTADEVTLSAETDISDAPFGQRSPEGGAPAASKAPQVNPDLPGRAAGLYSF